MNKILLLLTFPLFMNCQNKQNRTLIWSDEFEGNKLNAENWNFVIGNGCPELCGFGNNELQVYTDLNHTVENGMLTIKTQYKDSVYSSTRIHSQNKQSFQYGYFEFRENCPLAKEFGQHFGFWVITLRKWVGLCVAKLTCWNMLEKLPASFTLHCIQKTVTVKRSTQKKLK